MLKTFPPQLRNNIDVGAITSNQQKKIERKLHNDENNELDYLKTLKFTAKREHVSSINASGFPQLLKQHQYDAENGVSPFFKALSML